MAFSSSLLGCPFESFSNVEDENFEKFEETQKNNEKIDYVYDSRFEKIFDEIDKLNKRIDSLMKRTNTHSEKPKENKKGYYYKRNIGIEILIILLTAFIVYVSYHLYCEIFETSPKIGGGHMPHYPHPYPYPYPYPHYPPMYPPPMYHHTNTSYHVQDPTPPTSFYYEPSVTSNS
jgi:uncharacterized protein YdcH (DUF465 family)